MLVTFLTNIAEPLQIDSGGSIRGLLEVMTTISKVDEGLLALRGGDMRSKTLEEGSWEFGTGWFELREKVCGSPYKESGDVAGGLLEGG